MRALTVLIVDDEPLAVETLEGQCAADARLLVVGTAGDGEAALKLIAELQPDIVLLDIGMPCFDGLEVAAQLETISPAAHVVFVTAFDHHAVEAFDLAVTDYVLKPVQPERFRRAVDKVVYSRERDRRPRRLPAENLWLPRRGTVVRVPISAVVRVEADRDYAKIYTGTESYLLRTTMASIEKWLVIRRFLRIHRSTIIAYDQVVACRHVGNGSWAVVDSYGAEHAIGRSYLPEVRRALGLEPNTLEDA